MSTDSLYESLRRRHLADAGAALPRALARLDWSAEQLAAERTTRLRALLHLARTRSAWHRERLAHIDTSTFTEAELPSIAPMSKDDLMANFDRISTDPQLTLQAAQSHILGLRSDAYLHGRYHVNASSGSSGRRGVQVHDWDAWTESYVGFARHLVRHLSAVGGAAGSGVPVGAVIASHDATHMTSAMPQTFDNPANMVWHRFPVTQPWGETIDGLNRTQPVVLTSYASALHQLAAAARDGELHIAPRVLMSTSEPLLAPMRAAIVAAWPQARLLNLWASTEAAPLAMSCGLGRGLHLSDDLLIVEAVDEHGLPVPAGTRSAKIYLTNLYNPTPLPLIRYEIADQVTPLDGPCPCGSAHRRIDDIEGRSEDAFVYPGGIRVHPVVLGTRLLKESAIAEYRVRQTQDGAAVELVSSDPVDVDRLARALASDLRALGLSEAAVSVVRVDRLTRERSGKLKRFIPYAAGLPD
jgi:phenylacetate-CoA ligase